MIIPLKFEEAEYYYQQLDLIGEGGEAKIYEALDLKNNKSNVAIKFLNVLAKN